MEINKLIQYISEKTFKIISKVGTEKETITDSETNIIFPIKRDGSRRVSEQELKQIFIEQFNKFNKGRYKYSVETPTCRKYLFKGDNAPRVIDENDSTEGQSARIDMTIHDNTGKRIALIEFKALNPDISDFHKDFLKLSCEEDNNIDRYFIHLVEIANQGTISNIYNKYDSYSYQHEYSRNDYSKIIMILETNRKADVTNLEKLSNTRVICK